MSKTGGMTIDSILKNKSSFEQLREGNNNNGMWKSLISREPTLNQFVKTYRVFCFVRNPITRYISAYNMHLNKSRIPDSFSQLLDDKFARKYPGFYQHAHIPYTVHLPDLKYINFIGRFERFESDLSYIFKAWGVSLPTPIPKVNVGVYKKKINLTARHKKILYEKFKSDYEAFGYDR